MPSVTVRDFATEVKIPVDALLTQLREAGVSVENEDSTLSDADKTALLQHIRSKRGGSASAAASGSGRIGLKRKTTTELKLGGGRGAPSRTVSVEVRKRRTFEKPASEAEQQAAEQEQEQAREAEAEAERQREEAEAAEAAEKARVEEEAAEEAREAERQEAEAQSQAEAEQNEQEQAEEPSAEATEAPEPVEDADAEEAVDAVADDAGETPDAAEPTETAAEPASPAEEAMDPARRAAMASRSRAAENLRRAAEMKREQPAEAPPTPARPAAPGRADPGRGDKARKELHIKAGKSGRRDNKKSGGGRRARVQVDNRHGFEKPTAPVVRDVDIPESITVGDLAAAMAVKTGELIKTLMRLGVMATINQTLDQDTAVLVVEEMGHRPRVVSEEAEEAALLEAATGKADEEDENATSRAPIVTVMGHVDHGKTSLLDYVRKSRVASGEAGGITQHIGAYKVANQRGEITFLDTPGHAAFTRMRARGAQVTDIVILIIAADDGVMPQTREAIQHARAAGVPMIVAITKIDKEEADPERIRSELTKEEVVVEQWGGDVQCVELSSQTGEGIEELLDAVVLQAELLELKAVIDDTARGAIVESSVEKGRGPTATVLVRSGTLRQGDVVIAGPFFGRVRAMFNDAGESCKEAGPSTPVQILGLSGAPDAGEEVMSVTDERAARELAELREKKLREQKLAQSQAVRLDRAFEQMGSEDRKQLNIMIRGDVQGSIEALSEALTKIPSEEVKVNIVAAAVGGISESDVDLALASEAIIIGFNTRADSKARQRIQATGVDVRYYSIIYDVIDDVTDAISGLLGTELREKIVGTAEVREVFRASSFGQVAGCLVVDGEVRRGLPIRVLRDQVVIFEGELESLRRHKDDVQKVEAGTECGIAVKNYNDVKVGDQIECYEREEVRRQVKAEAGGGRR